MPDFLATAVGAALALLVVLWMAFWVIRLAVRYGVDDALRKHRDVTRQERERERTQEPTG